MSEATHLTALEKAQTNLTKFGKNLTSSNQKHHYLALARLFIVRESVLEALESLPEKQIGKKSTKSDSPSQVYRSCREDITTFSYMVTDLLTHKSSQCAFDVASRYSSIVGGLLGHFRDPIKHQALSLKARPLTGDSFAVVEEVLTDDIMRGDLLGLRKELEMIQIALGMGPKNSHRIRVRLAIDIVRIREILHTFFGEIHTENEKMNDEDDLALLCDVNTQISEDEDHLGLIVSSVIAEGASPEAIAFVQRYIDFLEKLAAYFEEYDVSVFQMPMIPVIPALEFPQGDDGGFRASMN